MAHYAFLDDDSIVVAVIVGRDEDDLVDGVTSWEEHYGETHGFACKRTSYHAQGGRRVIVDDDGQAEDTGPGFRKNYAGIGYRYDEERDAFIPPAPFPSWVLDETTCLWEPPVPRPDSGWWTWDESVPGWVEVTA